MPAEFCSTPDHVDFRSAVRRFVEEELRPRAREFDRRGRLEKALYRRMGELGLLGIRCDPMWGGGGRDWSYTTVLLEELVRCDNAGVVLSVSTHTELAIPLLHRFASNDLKQQCLVPAIAGDAVMAVAVTEPSGGSDVAAIRTRALRDGDDWVINGTKTFITNAATADLVCVLAVTDPKLGHGGLSQIIVPTNTRGVTHELFDKIGTWGSDTGVIFFEDVRVPVGNTIGEVGRGFQQQMIGMQHERLAAAISTLASARLVWEETRRLVRQRRASGTHPSEMQVMQWKLVEIFTEISMAEALIHGCIEKRMRGEAAKVDIPMAKLAAGRTARRVTHEAAQIHGEASYLTSSMVGRALVDGRLVSIGGGTDEVLMHLLARLLRL